MIQALLLLLLIGCTPTGKDVVITYDEGGVVASYASYYHNLPKDTRVVINGYCGSSCTLALKLPNTCVTDKGKLGFHLAYNVNLFGQHITDQELSDYLMSQYPANIKQWIAEQGGLTANIKILQGDDLHALVKHCA